MKIINKVGLTLIFPIFFILGQQFWRRPVCNQSRTQGAADWTEHFNHTDFGTNLFLAMSQLSQYSDYYGFAHPRRSRIHGISLHLSLDYFSDSA